MTSPSPIDRRSLLAGIALITIANAVALGGAAFNRSGTPEATLSLTERELELPYDWGRDRDNSGLAMTLQWRVVGAELADTVRFDVPYMSFSHNPVWLDSAKFASLGFRMTRPMRTAEGRAYYRKQLPKQVLLALEMDGPTYELVRARVREWAAREQSLVGTNLTGAEVTRRAESAREAVQREERWSTRLFVVDAGLDRAALRARYPDRARYAIVRGAVRPQIVGPDSASRIEGYITELAVNQINVPRRFRPVFDSVRRTATPAGELTTSSYSVSVAFGRRLEPWMTAAARKP